MTEGVDYSGTGNSDWNGLAAALVAAGKLIAGRYAVYDKSPGGRGLTGAEYQALRAHGIDVFLYYEETEAWMLEGYQAGVRAANRALDVIRTEGLPEGMAVYYSHDIDPEPQHFGAIDACLRGAAAVVGIERVAFYGGWLGIDHVAQTGTARWFAQTIAWEYGRGLHPAAHLYQYDIFGPTIYGTPTDLVRSVKPTYGGAAEALAPSAPQPRPPTPDPPPEPTTGPVPLPNAGRYKVKGELYRSDRRGGLGEDLTAQVIGGEVSVDVAAEVPTTFTAQLLDPGAVPAFGWVRPFLRLSWWDPTTGEDAGVREPLGCFQVMPPGETHTAAMGTGTLDGRDGCWLLKQGALGGNKTYAVGDNVVAAVVALVEGAGFKTHIPAAANTFRKKRTYDAGTPTLDVVNDLLMRVAYYPLWFDRDGVATSRKIRPRQKTRMRRTISSANGDVVGVVEIATDPERLCNRATCIVNDPDVEHTVFVTKSNHRASSPVSIENLGFVKAKVIEGMNVDSEAEALDLVNQALEDGASVQTRVSLATLPDAGFGFHETIWLEVARDDGTDVLSGSWWWSDLRIGFTPSQQPMVWTLNKLIPWTDE
jgi:hypothetical protein